MESLFQEGMSWGNRRQWVADHIIPYAAAATPEDVKGLSYYRNVRPVWPRQNIDKGAKVPPTGVAAGGGQQAVGGVRGEGHLHGWGRGIGGVMSYRAVGGAMGARGWGTGTAGGQRGMGKLGGCGQGAGFAEIPSDREGVLI